MLTALGATLLLLWLPFTILIVALLLDAKPRRHHD